MPAPLSLPPLPPAPARPRAWGRLAACALALGGALAAAAQPAPSPLPAADESALVRSYRAEALAYEHGEGVPRDGARAAAMHCRAARLGDARSQFALGWIHANGRGVPRDDALAAYFFRAAADQGIEQAAHMLARLPAPVADTPACMREPVALAVRVAPRPPPQAASPATPVAVPPPAPRPQLVELRRRAPRPIVDLVEALAPAYQLDPDLVLAIIQAESNFDPLARSPKNAQGLMQLIPDTAERFGVRNSFDPLQNVRGGMAYLRWLLAYFEGDLILVTAAYNAGEGAVERYRGIPPFRETREYVRRVLGTLGAVTHPFDASISEPSELLRTRRAALR
jgi:hypothetical protein